MAKEIETVGELIIATFMINTCSSCEYVIPWFQKQPDDTMKYMGKRCEHPNQGGPKMSFDTCPDWQARYVMRNK